LHFPENRKRPLLCPQSKGLAGNIRLPDKAGAFTPVLTTLPRKLLPVYVAKQIYASFHHYPYLIEELPTESTRRIMAEACKWEPLPMNFLYAQGRTVKKDAVPIHQGRRMLNGYEIQETFEMTSNQIERYK
jgi:hypothetical protein